jgi:hypothetical protein
MEKYNSNTAISPINDLYIENDHINEEDLMRLFEGEVLALRVPNYYPTDLCKLSLKYLMNTQIEHYGNAPSIGRAGMAFYETENNLEKVEEYYQLAKINIDKIRQAFSPYISPLDKLRLELQEIWTSGANIENIHDRKMFVGLCRLLEKDIDFLPHQDIFHLDSINNLRAKTLKSQIAANIYLDVDDQDGGELDMWSFGFDDNQYLDMLDDGSYGMSRNKLPPPVLSLKPNPGELILFNGRNLHAVRASKNIRASIACFIGYRGTKSPLTYWS